MIRTATFPVAGAVFRGIDIHRSLDPASGTSAGGERLAREKYRNSRRPGVARRYNPAAALPVFGHQAAKKLGSHERLIRQSQNRPPDVAIAECEESGLNRWYPCSLPAEIVVNERWSEVRPRGRMSFRFCALR